jgi:hypothetical protein
MDELGSRNGMSVSEEAHCGGLRGGGAHLLGTLGYERKALETGISLHGGSWPRRRGLLDEAIPLCS